MKHGTIVEQNVTIFFEGGNIGLPVGGIDEKLEGDFVGFTERHAVGDLVGDAKGEEVRFGQIHGKILGVILGKEIVMGSPILIRV